MMRWFMLLMLCVWPLVSWADATAWQAWRDGKAVFIMRHALAPGGGDPSGFALEDCSTQRNLNDIGRKQSVAWGEYIRSQHSGPVQVYSSQWCRCLETAQLMSLGEVESLPILNSFFAGQGDRVAQTEGVLRMFSHESVGKPTILVTHQVNFTALTQIYPSSGEAAILALPLTMPVKILARIEPR
ncbi:histidine phosphatase family protein [Marinomonas rhizomae]|uniref:histidine phosphatase family protein n=1 Tax=Marinomonas rhizomae TaxID=491948 RepID=UPI00210625E7|nr:histidine phosphatase family protein [Marinomonas rhizomae]UTV97957.1 histidine phosphatase family protein [Marinomonas rhizomae]